MPDSREYIVARIRPDGVTPVSGAQVRIEGRDQFSRPVVVYIIADVEPGETNPRMAREMFRRLINAISKAGSEVR